MRDLTQKQFEAAVKRSGWQFNYLGFVEVGHGRLIYRRNAGDNFRAQLAYLQREADRADAEGSGE
jgi:hypothetical protein